MNSLGSCSPSPESREVNLASFDEKLLEGEVLERINRARQSHFHPELKLDPVLQKAAADQAIYMAKRDRIGHTQNEKNKESPLQRVIFYGGKHQSVGENVLVTYVQTPLKVKWQKEPIVIRTYAELAEDMTKSWLNSPSHLQNILHKDYKYTGIRFSYNPKTKEVFASQVFGS